MIRLVDINNSETYLQRLRYRGLYAGGKNRPFFVPAVYFLSVIVPFVRSSWADSIVQQASLSLSCSLFYQFIIFLLRNAKQSNWDISITIKKQCRMKVIYVIHTYRLRIRIRCDWSMRFVGNYCAPKNQISQILHNN